MNLSFPRSALIVMHKCLRNSASRRLCNGSASFACEACTPAIGKRLCSLRSHSHALRGNERVSHRHLCIRMSAERVNPKRKLFLAKLFRIND